MSDNWYTDGDFYVVVRTGMPQDSVRIGTGESYDEALESLEITPIQSTGRDSGLSSALRWAENAGWISSADLDDDDGPEEEEVFEIPEKARRALLNLEFGEIDDYYPEYEIDNEKRAAWESDASDWEDARDDLVAADTVEEALDALKAMSLAESEWGDDPETQNARHILEKSGVDLDEDE